MIKVSPSGPTRDGFGDVVRSTHSATTTRTAAPATRLLIQRASRFVEPQSVADLNRVEIATTMKLVNLKLKHPHCSIGSTIDGRQTSGGGRLRRRRRHRLITEAGPKIGWTRTLTSRVHGTMNALTLEAAIVTTMRIDGTVIATTILVDQTAIATRATMTAKIVMVTATATILTNAIVTVIGTMMATDGAGGGEQTCLTGKSKASHWPLRITDESYTLSLAKG